MTWVVWIVWVSGTVCLVATVPAVDCLVDMDTSLHFCAVVIALTTIEALYSAVDGIITA